MTSELITFTLFKSSGCRVRSTRRFERVQRGSEEILDRIRTYRTSVYGIKTLQLSSRTFTYYFVILSTFPTTSISLTPNRDQALPQKISLDLFPCPSALIPLPLSSPVPTLLHLSLRSHIDIPLIPSLTTLLIPCPGSLGPNLRVLHHPRIGIARPALPSDKLDVFSVDLGVARRDGVTGRAA